MMPRTKHRIVTALAISLCIAVVVHQEYNATTDLCHASIQSSTSKPTAVSSLCKPAQHSWFSWIQGNSRSTQFHFVDLLELLNRFDHGG